MGTLIWLIFTTTIGVAIGHFFFPEYIILVCIIGFIMGLILRFFAGIVSGIGDVADVGLSLFD